MKINKTLAFLVAVSAAYGVTTGSIYGQINPAFQPPSGGTQHPEAVTPSYNLGEQFTVNSSFAVNALGFYDELPFSGLNGQGNPVTYPGITGPETVAIYNSSGGLVTSATVGLSQLVDSYYWQTITPVTLNAGSTYTVDVWTDGQTWLAVTPMGSIAANSHLTSVSPVYSTVGSGLAWPTTAGGADYYGPNFSIVPDGGVTVLLLGMGLAGLGCIYRKRA